MLLPFHSSWKSGKFHCLNEGRDIYNAVNLWSSERGEPFFIVNPSGPGQRTKPVGIRSPTISAKIEFKYKRLQRKFPLILFAYNLMLGRSKMTSSNWRGKCFERKKKITRIKIQPEFAIIGLQTTCPEVKKFRHQYPLVSFCCLHGH